MRYSARTTLINAAWFQLYWLIAVLMKNGGVPVLIGLLVAHCVWQPLSRSAILFIAIASLWGVTIDSLLLQMNAYQFVSNDLLIPAWLMLLWIGFALSLNFSLRPLFSFPKLGPLIGGLGGCFSTFGAMKLGAVVLPLPLLLSACIFFAIWAIHIWAFNKLYHRFLITNKMETH